MGAHGLGHPVPDSVLDGANEAHGLAVLAQGRVDHAGGGGFPVGARHAHELEIPGRMSEHRGRQEGQRLADVAHANPRDVLSRRLLGDDGGRSLLQRGIDEVVPVRGKAAYGDEERPRIAVARVVGDRGNVLVCFGVQLRAGQVLHEVAEPQRSSPERARVRRQALPDSSTVPGRGV